MKQILLISVAALLFVTSISTTFIFYNLYDKEKEHRKDWKQKMIKKPDHLERMVGLYYRTFCQLLFL
ncbi:hypothetical protein J7J00_24970 [Bacillus sp. ISL-4]|uniref:hypothetical protein n=1 Tax=Bacillus sp. ISL-4 TaxID=2819125 RepID=UPI001BEB6833|nr:hypothetical protein [Bacillus sp. ISL-4]MBT2668685.1 hypothetical protein [Bacillus sp. ISL-4]